MSHYRATNKRIIQRGAGGKFCRSTLADIGMAECETCGAIFFPDLDLRTAWGIDPRAMRDARRFCPEHGGTTRSPARFTTR